MVTIQGVRNYTYYACFLGKQLKNVHSVDVPLYSTT